MSLQFMKAGSSGAVALTGISKQAFDSDMKAGAASPDGPPGYQSVPFHVRMARMTHLSKLVDENGVIMVCAENASTLAFPGTLKINAPGFLLSGVLQVPAVIYERLSSERYASGRSVAGNDWILYNRITWKTILADE